MYKYVYMGLICISESAWYIPEALSINHSKIFKSCNAKMKQNKSQPCPHELLGSLLYFFPCNVDHQLRYSCFSYVAPNEHKLWEGRGWFPLPATSGA